MASRQQGTTTHADSMLHLQDSKQQALSSVASVITAAAPVAWQRPELIRRDRSQQLTQQIMIYAGADVLFVGKGADVGVTVSPIRINSLREFGTVEAVGDRLLGAEKAKAGPWLMHALACVNKAAHALPWHVSSTADEMLCREI